MKQDKFITTSLVCVSIWDIDWLQRGILAEVAERQWWIKLKERKEGNWRGLKRWKSLESPSCALVLISAVCFLSCKRISLTRTNVWFFAANPLWLPLFHHFVSVPTPLHPSSFAFLILQIVFFFILQIVSLINSSGFTKLLFYPCLFFALFLNSSKWESTLFMTSISYLNHMFLSYLFFVYCFYGTHHGWVNQSSSRVCGT